MQNKPYVNPQTLPLLNRGNLSKFGHFWLTFIGYNFLDIRTKRIYTKGEMFHRAEREKLNLATTLLFPRHIKLITYK